MTTTKHKIVWTVKPAVLFTLFSPSNYHVDCKTIVAAPLCIDRNCLNQTIWDILQSPKKLVHRIIMRSIPCLLGPFSVLSNRKKNTRFLERPVAEQGHKAVEDRSSQVRGKVIEGANREETCTGSRELPCGVIKHGPENPRSKFRAGNIIYNRGIFHCHVWWRRKWVAQSLAMKSVLTWLKGDWFLVAGWKP